MLTYLVRPRGLYKEPDMGLLEFPGMVCLEFRLEPGGSFRGQRAAPSLGATRIEGAAGMERMPRRNRGSNGRPPSCA